MITSRKLEAVDRPKELWEFQVKGVGDFPIDMLRYDTCWPARSEDISKFNVSRFAEAEELRAVRTITLQSYFAPTVARWASFGWSVI